MFGYIEKENGKLEEEIDNVCQLEYDLHCFIVHASPLTYRGSCETNLTRAEDGSKVKFE